MPELAEVEYYRKQWNTGLGAKVLAAELYAEKRIFRGTDVTAIQRDLPGAKLIASEARGKQMAFQFSRGIWIAIHLGMTGKLRVEPADFAAAKHDHLVLQQKQRSLVFSDPRQFGRVLYFQGRGEPPWWSKIAPALTSKAFTQEVLRDALQRHRKLPIKATLLLQQHFPGVGNWMADEILWRAKIDPRTASGNIEGNRLGELWKSIRYVCAGAIKHIGSDFSDPPTGWFFHVRWGAKGKCPRDGSALKRATIGGRTTAWCAKCQR
ncbi:MAG TPA: DNA-formamidopyrimidine glycosylase family protein [Candidatus Limnocylindria bacterium]|nr:DNA-formamidopyrimidine glycosylase family protein [Candidatus Limnocylindria bacterium]